MPPPAPISEDDATATPTQSTIDNLARHSENTRRLLSSLEELRDTLESRVNQLATSVQRLREQARELEISMDSHRRAQEQDATWDGPVEATLPEPIPIHTTTSAIATELSTHPRPITAGDINRLLDRASQSLNIAPEGTDQSRESLSRLEPYRNINQAVQANMSELEGTVSSLRRAREGLETGRAAADSAGGGGVAESGSGDTRRSRRISSTRRREMDAEYSRIDAEYRRIRARIQDPVTVPPLNADLPTSTDGILRRDMEARRRLAMIRECAPRNAPMVPSGATPPQGLPATNLGVIRNQKAPIVVRSTAPSPASFAPSSTGALVDGDDEDTRGPLGAGEPTSSDRPQRRARPVRAELLNLRAEMENAQAETQALMDMIQQVDSNQQRSASRPPGTSSTVDTDAAAPVAEQSVQETLRRERVARIRARADQIRGDDPEGTSVEAQAASAPQARRPAFEIAPYGGAAWQARRRWGMHQPDRLSRGEIGSDDDTPSRRRRRNRNAGNANSAGNADSPSDELDGDAATLEVRTDPAIEPAAVMTPPSREQAQVDLLERIQREHQLGTRTLNQTQETALYAYLSNQAQRDARHTMAQAALIRVRAQRPDPQPPASTGPRPVLTHVPGISVTRISLADSRRPEQQGGDRSNGTHAGGLSGAGPARQVDESLTRRGQRVMQAVQGDAPAAPFTAGRARHLAESNAAAQDAGARGLTFDDAQREVIAAREARLRAYERYQAILQASRPLLTPQPGGSGTVSPVRPESVDQENEVLQVRARDDLISAQLRESRAVATREWTRSPLREAGTPIVGRSEPSSSRRDREVTGGIRRTTEITTETMVSLPVGTIGLPRHERSAARVTEADAYPPRDADGTVDLISLTQRMTPEQQDRTTLTHELMQAEERMDLAWAEIVDERNRDADRLERELDTELFTRTETGLPPPRTRQPIPAVQATQPPAGASARTSGPQARLTELRQRLQQSDQLLAAVESRSLSDMQQRRAARDAILAEANSMVSAGTTRSTGVPAERTATDTSGGTSATIAPTETSNPTPASIAAAAAVTATRGTARREDTARQESSPWRNGSASQIPLLGRPITSSEEQPSGVSERQMNEDSPSETAYAPTLRDGETSVRLGQIVVIGSDEEDVSESSAEEDEDDSDEDHSESDDEVILHVPDDTDEAPSSNDSTPNARDHPRVPSPALNPRVLPDRAAYLAARNMSAITSGVNTREATAAPLELEPARSISSMVEEGELGAEGWPTASCPNVRRHRPYVSLLDL